MARIHSNRQPDLLPKTEMNVVFGMDGTLSNDEWRRHFLTRDEELKINWDAYHRDSLHDLPHLRMCSMYQAFLNYGHGIIIVTGRPIKYRDQTIHWLQEYNLQFNSLLMRPENDYSIDSKLKLRLLKENGLLPTNVISVFSSRPKTVELLHSNEYLTFHVRG